MPTITKHLINRNCTFINQMYEPLVFVVHRTAGHTNVQQLYDYWQSTCISSHFGISYDGYGYDPLDIWQFVELWDGAGANCCPESGCHPFFERGGNANTYTISVEVCTPNTANQGLLTSKQEEALIFLIRDTCAKLGIPVNQYSEYWNDYENSHTWIGNNGGIGMHRDPNPHDKRMCPGDPYYQGQMDRIIQSVKGGSKPPWVYNEHMEQQFNDVWHSSQYGVDSGIYQIVKKGFSQGKYGACSPTSPEINTVDWSGGAIIYQTLSNGLHAEYAGGFARVYDASNRQLYEGRL